jgi:hypothetical protein
MDDNPYKSPEAEPQIDKPPTKPPSRYLDAMLFGVGVLGGLSLLQEVGLGILEVVFNRKIAPPGSMLPMFLLTASPVGVIVAWSIWRHPKSRRLRSAALLLMVSPFALWAISIATIVLIAWWSGVLPAGKLR